MEYYHYINIFGTNGLEDVLVICFLITFVLFVRNLSRPPKWQRRGLSGPDKGMPPRTVVIVDNGSVQEEEDSDLRHDEGAGPAPSD